MTPASAAPRCPICRRPVVHEFRPFCSKRCRDVDLGRWFGEAYRLPGEDAALQSGTDDEI